MTNWYYFVAQNDDDQPIVYDVAQLPLRRAKDNADQILLEDSRLRIVWMYIIDKSKGRPDFHKAVYVTRRPF